MSITPLTFTGVSSFSNDLQTVLSRAVSIASLPLKTLQNDDSDTLHKKTLLGTLNGAVSSLGSSLTALGTLAANRAISASSSDSTKVSVVNTGSSSSAVYTISGITSVAKAASETSLTGYADSNVAAVSSTGTLQLTLGAQNYPVHLTPQTNNLAGLRDAINKLGVGVTASVLTTGTGANPNYLSLSSNATGATTLRLADDPLGVNTNLLTTANQGSNAVFKLNGVDVSKSSNSVNDVISGATFTILDTTTGTQAVTLSLATDRNQLSSAIQNFANNYNALVDQVGTQVGSSAGLLSGDFIVRNVQSSLRSLTSFQGSGSIKNLSDLGIELSPTGKISLNSATFNSLSDSQISGAFAFFGSAVTGFGALAQSFTQLSDPVTGLIKLQQDGYDKADSRLQKQIAALTDQINRLQAGLASRLELADSQLAGLESQQKLLTSSILALNLASYGKQTI